MADFSVVIFTTFLIIFLPYLFWKWINRRNRLLMEEGRRAMVQPVDVRKNRLKRFDINNTETLIETPAGNLESESSPTKYSLLTDDKAQPSESTVALANDANQRSDREELILSTNAGEGTSTGHTKSILSAISYDNSNSNEDFGIAKSDCFKPQSSQRWVTLTLCDENKSLVPATRPLTSLDELRSWNEGFDEFNVSSSPLVVRSTKLEQRARTIVCHDMKGGYVEDRFVQGYPSTECYRIYHWQYIDIFIYFSHNFITIPPPCWTNAAHKHGTRVLGTFITEWEDGAKLCAELFNDKNLYRAILNQLVCIAKYYGFDGWLINIENPIQPSQVNHLIDFLDQLTKEMHQEIPESLVIWYDSVTYKGELEWQNGLNPENRIFFDVSDGIFVNYIWNEGGLMASAQAAGHDRRYDVYVGVDVFGRGCFGGGGWNTNKATKVIKGQDLSLALFAPGWVFENYQSTFEVNQNKFWDFIAPDCHIHTLEYTLPFVTSFCQGYGERVYKYGKVIHDKAWSHMGAQQIQPSYTNHIYSLGGQDGVLVTSMGHSCQDAYNGGGCLLIQGSAKTTTTSSKTVVRLFKTDILLPSTVIISFTTKFKPNDLLDVALQLHMDKKPTYIMLCPHSEKYSQDTEDVDRLNEALLQRYGVRRSKQLNSDHLAIAVGQEHYRLFAPLSLDEENKVHSACCNDDGDALWTTRYYFLAEKDLKGSRIKEVRLVLINKTTKDCPDKPGPTQFQFFVGEVKIIDAVTLRRPLPNVTALRCCESEVKTQENDNDIMLSLTLSWSYESNTPWERFEVYYISSNGAVSFVGLSYVMSFYVSKLAVHRYEKKVTFAVQAVDCAQCRTDLENCPTITVHWS